jgi:hypothetical protein
MPILFTTISALPKIHQIYQTLVNFTIFGKFTAINGTNNLPFSDFYGSAINRFFGKEWKSAPSGSMVPR